MPENAQKRVEKTVHAATENVTYGDVNSDGKISILDMIALKSYITEKNTKGFSVKAADLDGDGTVSAKDAVELAMYLLNQTGSFSYEMNIDSDKDGLSFEFCWNRINICWIRVASYCSRIRISRNNNYRSWYCSNICKFNFKESLINSTKDYNYNLCLTRYDIINTTLEWNTWSIPPYIHKYNEDKKRYSLTQPLEIQNLDDYGVKK